MGFQVYRLERNNNVLWGASVVRIMTRKKTKTVQYRTVHLLKNKYFQVKQFKQLIKYQELLFTAFSQKGFCDFYSFSSSPFIFVWRASVITTQCYSKDTYCTEE